MPIHIGTSTKNQQQIAIGITQMQKVYVGDKLVWQKILELGGYGMLYNWFCTQQQPAVEYGYLYNWYAATDARNICSAGFHVPIRTEIDTLISYLSTNIGGKLKETGFTHWDSPNSGATNEVLFNARGNGDRLDNGAFSAIKSNAYFWSSTSYSPTLKSFLSLTRLDGNATQSYTSPNYGMAVRPMKDSTTLTNGQTGTYVDPSGIIYPTICIGTQEWVACNIMTKHYRNGDAIPEVTDNTAWTALTTGARCSYNNTESNAGSTKKLSSSDSFIVPPYSIYVDLRDFIDPINTYNTTIVGGVLKEVGLNHWNSPNIGATNELGFTSVGAGIRVYDSGEFVELKSYLRYLTSDISWLDIKSDLRAEINNNDGTFILLLRPNNEAGSIRLCNPTTSHANGYVGSYTQNDGTVISTIVINGVEWTMDLKETKWSDGSDIQNITDNTAWSLLQEAACCDINNDPLNR